MLHIKFFYSTLYLRLGPLGYSGGCHDKVRHVELRVFRLTDKGAFCGSKIQYNML